MDLAYIFTNGDDVAAGVQQYYVDHQLAAPALIGQENQLSGFLMKIPTIDHHFVEIGEQALKLVISAPTADKKIAVPSQFIVGSARSYID